VLITWKTDIGLNSSDRKANNKNLSTQFIEGLGLN
jgi:hypothetical protein